MNIVHVVGTGTIGEPLIGLLALYKEQLGIDEVTFHKKTPLLRDKTKVLQLLSRGAKLAVDEGRREDFENLGLRPTLTAKEAVERATVVIDCTPKGVGLANKKEFYEPFRDKVKGFIAQGSETGFGIPYAFNVNDHALKGNQFVQVVSCNTHNIAALLSSLMYDFKIHEARFVLLRRASDISQDEDFVPGVEVDTHKLEGFGTHHARDAWRLFNTLGHDLHLYSSSCVLPTQYMHAMHFALKFQTSVWHPDLTLENLKGRLRLSPFISLTQKTTSNSIFSFGRDYGCYGRILNQTVVSLPTLSLRETYDNQLELMGFCYTPQDGNSLVSSIAAALWFLNDGNLSDAHAKLSCLNKFIFAEI